VTYGRELTSPIDNHIVYDDTPVLVVTFTGVEGASNREDFRSDIEASSSRCVQTLGL
jgi:hypothetical protein